MLRIGDNIDYVQSMRAKLVSDFDMVDSLHTRVMQSIGENPDFVAQEEEWLTEVINSHREILVRTDKYLKPQAKSSQPKRWPRLKAGQARIAHAVRMDRALHPHHHVSCKMLKYKHKSEHLKHDNWMKKPRSNENKRQLTRSGSPRCKN